MRITVSGAGAIALSVGLAVGCKGDADEDESVTARCTDQLDAYCDGGDPCPDFDQSANDAQDMAARCGEFVGTATTGTCGSHLYVQVVHWGGGWTRYFDVKGNLVGVTVVTDANGYCNGSSLSIDYGLVPDCDPSPQFVFCDATGHAAGGAGNGGSAGAAAGSATGGTGSAPAGGASGANG